MQRHLQLLILILLATVQQLQAQQLPQYSQYNMNKFIMNPGVTGSSEYIDLKAGYRNQWVNFEDSPVTYYVSGHAPIGKTNRHAGEGKQGRYHDRQGYHGVGGYVINDVTGPTERSWAYASYAYHLPVADKIYASMGAFVGVKRFLVDGSQLTTFQSGDPLIGRQISKSMPDASAGIWLYSEEFYAGFSAQQLLGNQVAFEEFSQLGGNKGTLNRHYFLTGGYNYKLTEDISLIPSAMLKYEASAPLSVDLTGRMKYKDKFWGGLSYRHQDAISVLTGVLIDQRYSVGYSFDLTTTDIRQYSAGTHEIVVGVRLNLPGRVVCPTHFW